MRVLLNCPVRNHMHTLSDEFSCEGGGDAALIEREVGVIRESTQLRCIGVTLRHSIY